MKLELKMNPGFKWLALAIVVIAASWILAHNYASEDNQKLIGKIFIWLFGAVIFVTLIYGASGRIWRK